MSMVSFHRMNEELRPDAEALLTQFLREDEHYLASSAVYGDRGGPAVGRALQLFLSRPELGFVWLGTNETGPVAVCVVCFAVSTSTGTLVAKLDDVYVAPHARGRGTGTLLLTSLAAELSALGVARIDTSVHVRNVRAKRYYERNGFRPLGEERLSLLLNAEEPGAHV